MSRHIRNALFTVTGVALMWSTALAQEPRVDTDNSTVMFVGCVQRTEQPGTLGTTIPGRTATPENIGVLANSGEPAPGFILADAAADFSSGLKPGARTDLPKRYVLVGADNDLAKLEGQRVRVSGKIVPSTKPEEQPVGTVGSEQVKSETQRLKVSAVEVIAGKCSTQ
jgi:hypothetical protein